MSKESEGQNSVWVFWVTGLPGSGKTTYSHYLAKRLKDAQIPVIVLDGDEMRDALESKFGYSMEDRIFLGKTYVNLSRYLLNQGFNVIVSTVSLIKEVHEHRESKLPDAKVIFINADNEILDKRNKKKLRTINQKDSPGVTQRIDVPNRVFLELNGRENEDRWKTITDSLVANCYE